MKKRKSMYNPDDILIPPDTEIVWLAVTARPSTNSKGIATSLGKYRFGGTEWAGYKNRMVEVGPIPAPTMFHSASRMIAAGLECLLRESPVRPEKQAVIVVTDCREYAVSMRDPCMSLPLVGIHPETFCRTTTIFAPASDIEMLTVPRPFTSAPESETFLRVIDEGIAGLLARA